MIFSYGPEGLAWVFGVERNPRVAIDPWRVAFLALDLSMVTIVVKLAAPKVKINLMTPLQVKNILRTVDLIANIFRRQYVFIN